MSQDPVDKKIPVMELFGPTIQGEGLQIGVQTYFIRFGGCDYRCTMCDSMHAVDPNIIKSTALWATQAEIFKEFQLYYKEGSTKWVTFTGGNPAIHNLDYLVAKLHSDGFKINVETQGTIWQDWLAKVDCLTISPKGPGMGETTDIRVLQEFLDNAFKRQKDTCVKVVIFDQRDLDFAAELYSEYRDATEHWYLSLGNPYPPGYHNEMHPASHTEAMEVALQQYRRLFEDIQTHPLLSQFRFLPQWHWFVWSNDKGR